MAVGRSVIPKPKKETKDKPKTKPVPKANITEPTTSSSKPKTTNRRSSASVEDEIRTISDIRFDIPISQKNTKTIKREHQILFEREEFYRNCAWCHLCGKPKRKEQFYINTDPLSQSGLSPICRQCAKDLAYRKDKNGRYHKPTRDSLILALRYLDKPFIETVYNSSVNEAINNESENFTVVSAYFKNIQMQQYVGLTYADSDLFKEEVVYDDERDDEHIEIGSKDQVARDRADVIRLLHYDPFEKESPSDQPFLYSQLLGMLDSSEDANDDMMRTSSAINIVRCFLQISKIDDSIAKVMGDSGSIARNAGTIKSMQESKQKMTSMITSLAEESCLSLQHSKHATKGENTWTGKLKKIKDLNLRAGEVNGFDMETCKGMRQVMDASNASILKALKLDESEYSDMIAEQREMITKLNEEMSNYKEIARILLRENLDLKEVLADHDIIDESDLTDLESLFSVFNSDYNAGENVINEIGGDSNE